MTDAALKTTCCVVGGGPAGMMLGYLLARSGVQVSVLEKHNDFFRDFRGDTVHPSTLEVLHELGLLDEFLKLPHQKVFSAGAVYGDFAFQAPDFRHVPAHCKFIALMPQWDFLNFLSRNAMRFPSFDLRLQHEAVDLITENDRVAGVTARGPGGASVEIRADLVVGCDGRHSATRRASQLELLEFGAPIDVLWFQISRQPNDPEDVLGCINYGKAMILINRHDYFQCGLIIRKGSFDEIKRQGLEALQNDISRLAPHLHGRVKELQDWERIKLLTVQLNRLRRWYRDGLLCIGDAAHAMSPAGGVGINLAIQDAVATANLLSQPLLNGRVTEALLATVQERREYPTRATQAVQARIHKVFARIFEHPGPVKAPWSLKAAVRVPGIHRALGYAVGMGVRPEHVRGARPETGGRRPYGVAIGAAVGVAVAMIVMRWRSRRRALPPATA